MTSTRAVSSNDSRSFQRARARLGAFALHSKHPEIASSAGRKGGLATVDGYSGGRRAWGVAMAMRRWHGTPVRIHDSQENRTSVIREPVPGVKRLRPRSESTRADGARLSRQSQLSLF